MFVAFPAGRDEHLDRTPFAGEGRKVRHSEIERRIAAFPQWHYEFDLAGCRTPVWNPALTERHAQRARYFFDPLVAYFGGSLSGKRVLDLGCNAGFWALRAIEAGCDLVVGVDARPTNIDQAHLVFEASQVAPDRYEFVVEDVLRIDPARWRPFDIVLNLGLLYHVSRPVELLEISAAMNTDVLLIDTALSKRQGNCLEVRFESEESPQDSIAGPMVLYPTAGAVVEMTRALGYRTAILAPDPADLTACPDYTRAARRAFVCTREGDPDSFFQTERGEVPEC